MSNRNGDIIPDSKRREAIGAVGFEDLACYESKETVYEPLNITWDGNTEGLVCVEGQPVYKVSDIVLTDEELKLCTYETSAGETVNISDRWDDPHFIIAAENVTGAGMILSARIDGAVFNVGNVSFTLPEKGIYVGMFSDSYVKSITTAEPIEQTKTVVHKLDKKFLPDGVGGNIFNINVSYDDANSEYISDKTYEEIKAAEEAKMPIVGTFTDQTGLVFTLIGCDLSGGECCCLAAFDVQNLSVPIIHKIEVYENGDVFVSDISLATRGES